MDTQMNLSFLLYFLSVVGLADRVSSLPKEYSCYSRPADVIFILDSSNSIWNPDFDTQLRFISDVIEFFPIGQDFIHVGVITYSSFVKTQFNLDSYNSVEEIQDAVKNIKQQGGDYTHTDKALQAMRESFNDNPGSRPGVIKIGIVITDGRSTNTRTTEMQAQFARAKGINLFAIGVGQYYDDQELMNIANMPSEEFMWLVENYDSLTKIKEMLAIKTCTVTDPPTTTRTTTTTTTTAPRPNVRYNTQTPSLTPTPSLIPLATSPPSNAELLGNTQVHYGPHGCTPKQPLDLAFIIDDKMGGTRYKRHMWELIRNVIDRLDYEDDLVRISFIRDCAEVPEMKMSRYYDKGTILDHLDSTRPVLERTPGLLRATSNKLDEHSELYETSNLEEGEHRHKVAIYITNGESRDLEGTLREAQVAKFEKDIEIFAVGIGEEVNLVELNALVSCEPSDHLHTVAQHEDLHELHHIIARQLCQAPATS